MCCNNNNDNNNSSQAIKLFYSFFKTISGIYLKDGELFVLACLNSYKQTFKINNKIFLLFCSLFRLVNYFCQLKQNCDRKLK